MKNLDKHVHVIERKVIPDTEKGISWWRKNTPKDFSSGLSSFFFIKKSEDDLQETNFL